MIEVDCFEVSKSWVVLKISGADFSRQESLGFELLSGDLGHVLFGTVKGGWTQMTRKILEIHGSVWVRSVISNAAKVQFIDALSTKEMSEPIVRFCKK